MTTAPVSIPGDGIVKEALFALPGAVVGAILGKMIVLDSFVMHFVAAAAGGIAAGHYVFKQQFSGGLFLGGVVAGVVAAGAISFYEYEKGE